MSSSTFSDFDKHIPELKHIMYRKKGFYLSYQQFLTSVRKELFKDVETYTNFKPFLEKFYYAQEIVQIMGGFPRQTSLQNDPSVYPKIISFEPFERFYVDQAFINLYPEPKTVQAKPKKLPVVPEIKHVDEPEYNKPDWTSQANWEEFLARELIFPRQLRVFYSTGNPFRLNAKERKSPSKVKLFQERAKYIMEHQDQFAEYHIDKAKTGLYEELLQGWQKNVPKNKT
jgi:hypothetical protein